MRKIDLNQTIGTGLLAMVWLAGTVEGAGERVIGFEDLTLEVPPLEAYAGPGGGVYYNGSDGAGGFESGGVTFGNTFTDYGGGYTGWSGWAYSTTTDVETAGFGNQYSSFAGAAASGNVYAVSFAPSVIELPVGAKAPVSIAVSNSTYAGISMRDGDDFAKKFGEGDYFKLSISGYGKAGQLLGAVEVYLADFRTGAEPGILTSWREVALDNLDGGTGENVYAIGFTLESTDNGLWGMNTPAYIAVDDIVLGASPTWGGYDLEADGWVDTGDLLGWVYPTGDFVWMERLGKWTYLPATQFGAGTGVWVHVPR